MSYAPWETWARKLRAAWSGGSKGSAMLGSIAALIGDNTDANSLAGLLEQMPATATDEASVDLALAERQLEAGPAMTFADKQAFAAAAPNLNRFRGRPLGTLLALHYAGFPDAVIVQQNGQGYMLSAAPNLDSLASLFPFTAGLSWFDVADLGPNPLIPASADGKPAIPAGTVPWWVFGPPMDGDGNQWNNRYGVLFPTYATDPLLVAANLARIKRVLLAWKPGQARCAGIWVCTSGAMWGLPGLTWASFSWGGSVTSYSVE